MRVNIRLSVLIILCFLASNVFSQSHDRWKELSFENIRTEGAFQISAKVAEGKVKEIKVKSLAGGTLRLAHGMGNQFQMNGKPFTGTKLEF